jgi:hypothetical protein
MTGHPAADLVDLIGEAAVQVQAAAYATQAPPFCLGELFTAEFADVLASWLFEAADRERHYRRDNPDWTAPAQWEEAWTAGLLSAQLLGRDPAQYQIHPPTED